MSDLQGSHFSVDGAPNAYSRHCIYYHWDAAYSAASASSLHFFCVRASGQWVRSGMWFGGIDAGDNVQADNVYLYSCQTRAGVKWTKANQLCQVGIGFGSGTSANALNYNAFGSIVTSTGVGISVASTNAYVSGGDVEDNDTTFHCNNQIQYAVFENIRVENSSRLYEHTGTQSVDGHIVLRNILFNLNAPENEYQEGRDLPLLAQTHGTTTLENIRVGSPTFITTGVASATSTTVTPVAGGLPTTVGAGPFTANAQTRRGWLLEVTAGTGVGQSRIVVSNTSMSYTVDRAWDTIPDATSTIRVSFRPRIYVGGGRCTVRDCGFYATPAEHVFVIDTYHVNAARGDLDGYTTLFDSVAPNTWQTNVGRLSFHNQPGYHAWDRVIAAVAEMSGGSNYPNTQTDVLTKAIQAEARIYGHIPGVITIPTAEHGIVNVANLGSPPAPTVAKRGPHTGGTTTYTYYVVPKIPAGDGTTYKVGLASPAATIANCAATLDFNNYIIIYPGPSDHGPLAIYDILRGDTGHSVATNVPWYKMPWQDTRNATDPYTYTGVDGTGNATVAGTFTLGSTALVGSDLADATGKVPYPIYDAGNSGAAITLTYASTRQKQQTTLTGNATITLAGIPSGGALTVRVKTGAGGFAATFATSGLGTLRWFGGSAPTITAAANKIDELAFVYDGTDTVGYVVGQGA